MKIKAIIFDYGQVLNAPEDAAAEMARRAPLAERLGLKAEELWPYLFEGDAARKWMTGRYSWETFWKTVLKPKGIVDPEEVEAYSQELFGDNESINIEMLALLKELRGRYKLAVVSNASWNEAELRNRLYNGQGIPEGTFDHIISSSSVGHVKPDPEIFQTALKRLGVRAEETVFTDDLVNFTKAAGEMGFHVHTFTTPEAFRAFLVEMGILNGR